jgi:LPXTG-motif cell wall-anchored protein
MLCAVGVAMAAPRVVHAAATEQCTRDTTTWTGSATLDGSTTSFATGTLIAPPALGETLRAVGASANGIDSDGLAHPIDVKVGGTSVAAGVVLPGGPISLAWAAPPSLVVQGVAVVTDRCVLVDAGVQPSAPAPVVTRLPDTGPTDTLLVVAACAAVALGGAFVLVARRR